MMANKRGLASMVYNFFDKKSAPFGWLENLWSETLATQDKSASVSGIINENILNQELAKELQKPVIRDFCGADLADMQSISKFD